MRGMRLGLQVADRADREDEEAVGPVPDGRVDPVARRFVVGVQGAPRQRRRHVLGADVHRNIPGRVRSVLPEPNVAGLGCRG